MPELPEVETVARDLREAVVGRTVQAVLVLRADVVRFPDPATFTAHLTGAGIDAVARRGKFLQLALHRPAAVDRRRGEDLLVVHLGMTGHLDVSAADAEPRPHTHLRCRLDDGRELRFADARRFGRVLLGPLELLVASRLMPRLGVEPLSPEFTPAALDSHLRVTRRTVKAALLDQRGIAGLGNIYVDEACHAAGIRPQRRCHRLTRAERARLHAAIVAVLEKGVRNRGTTIDDYRDIWNARGTNQDQLQAYGRGGSPCLRCGALMRRGVVAQRGTSWCPACQR